MAKQKPTLNNADLQLLIGMMKLHFVTQDQFTDFRSEVMENFDKLLKNTTNTNDELLVTQSVVSRHTVQINRLEEALSLPNLI